MTLSEFWAVTPWEVGLVVDAANWRQEQGSKRLLWQAWEIASLGASAVGPLMGADPTFPTLAELMNPPRQLSPEDLARMRAANARIREIRDAAKGAHG